MLRVLNSNEQAESLYVRHGFVHEQSSLDSNGALIREHLMVSNASQKSVGCFDHSCRGQPLATRPFDSDFPGIGRSSQEVVSPASMSDSTDCGRARF